MNIKQEVSKQELAKELAADFEKMKFPIKRGDVLWTPKFDAERVAVIVEALRLYGSTVCIVGDAIRPSVVVTDDWRPAK